MNNKNKLSIKKPEVLFLSLFGSGFLPKAPGTWGTLAVTPIFYGYCKLDIPVVFVIPLYIITFIGSIYLINFAQKKYEIEDASWIVIDEALGFLLIAPFCHGDNIIHLVILFILFRAFDALKPFPINWFDKNIKGGLGVILDDIVAGIMTLGLYKAIFYFI